MPLPVADPRAYEAQLEAKLARFSQRFAPFGLPTPSVFRSAPLHYRMRAEFAMWHDGEGLDYVMFDPQAPRQRIIVDGFPAASARICETMPRLLERMRADTALRRRLFQTGFLSTLSGELLITLVYHRPLDDEWADAARELAGELDAQIVGRSRKQKVVIDRDWLLEEFELDGRQLRYQQVEGSFTQPNGEVNRHMLSWACAHAAGLGGDLLELYCGNGNFTIALAPLFDKVLATEVSKSSVAAARYNLCENHIGNVALVRMSSEEISGALARERDFNRLRNIDLDDFRFSTLFVDPPRCGLDAATVELASGFQHILYISCNPQTLADNVAALACSHRIAAAAVFDQFPYTDHLECGVLLTRHRP